jgi:uncharacterized membrane protein
MIDLFLAFHRLPFGLIVFSISGATFWPYFGGGAILAIGVAMARRDKLRQASGFGPLILLGSVSFAMAMAIFGMDHLVAAKAVSTVVPSWIPGQLFWAYFVGVALIAAALSLATQIQSRLASALLGIKIFLFVLLIHIPACFAIPYDKTRLTIVFRDSALSAGALAFAVSSFEQARMGSTRGGVGPAHLHNVGSKLIAAARLLIAIAIGVFGIDHFLYPTFAPGIPQEGPVFVTMPSWIPGHVLWAYLTGTIFVVGTAGLATRKYARSAATVLGSTVLVLAVFVYLPLTIDKASDVANGLNYLAIHFALAGSVFLLAGSLPAVVSEYGDVSEVEGSSFRRVSDS